MKQVIIETVGDKVKISVPRERSDFLDMMKWMNGVRLEDGKWTIDKSHEKRARQLCNIFFG